MGKPKAFNTYLDNQNKLEMLSDEQAGRLYKSLCVYASTGEKPDFNDDVLLKYAFTDFSTQIDRDFEKYDDTVERRKEAAKTAANARWNKENECETHKTQCEKCETHKTHDSAYAKNANACERINGICDLCDSCQEEKEEEKEEEYVVKEKEVKEKEKSDNACYDRVRDQFNSICVSLPKVHLLSDTRKKRIHKARDVLGDVSFEDLFRMVEKSDFLSGREKDWCASFDWIFEPRNLTKILEGNYKNKSKRGSVYSVDTASFDVKKYENNSLFD